MGWNDTREDVEANSGGGGLFLKLQNDGDKARFMILGEPYAYTRNGFKGPSRRVLVNVFVPERGDDPVCVWEASAPTFKLLCSLGDELPIGTRDGEPVQRMVLLKRNGAKGDPNTTYMILDGGPIPDEILGTLDSARPHDLVEIARKSIEKDGGAARPERAPQRQAQPARAAGFQRAANPPTTAARRPSAPASAPAARAGGPGAPTPEQQKIAAPPAPVHDDASVDADELPF